MLCYVALNVALRSLSPACYLLMSFSLWMSLRDVALALLFSAAGVTVLSQG